MKDSIKLIFTLLLSLILIPPLQAQYDDVNTIQSIVTRNDAEFNIHFLASDEFLGRDTGTRELKIVSRYIATWYQQNGLKFAPGNDSYFQDVPFQKIKAPDRARLEVSDSTFHMTGHLIVMSSFRGDIEAQ